jgi:hypothetical protein
LTLLAALPGIMDIGIDHCSSRHFVRRVQERQRSSFKPASW